MPATKMLRNAFLTGALALASVVSLATPAPAVDWSSYRLGDFYDISQASDPVVRAAGHATVFFGNATGFVISPEGHVLTNHHVYESFGNGGTVYVEWTGGNSYRRSLQLSLVARSSTYDVAIYKANVSNIPYLKIDARPARVGEDVFVVGHPNTRSLEVSFGKVLATGLTIAGRPSIEYSAQTWWGSSGSPVCDRAGNALAIHWGWDANGQSNGRLTGVPFNLIVRAVPQIAQVYQRYGVGAAVATTGATTTNGGGASLTTGTSGSSGSAATTGSSGAGASTGRPSTGSFTGSPTISGGRAIGRVSSTTVGGGSGTTTSGGSAGSAASSIPELVIGGSVGATLTRTGDLNTWRVALAARGDLVISLAGPTSADFDLAIWAWNFTTNRGAKAADSVGATSSETITIRGASPGTYLVVVNSYDGAGPYRLSARLDQQTTVGGGAAATGGVIGTATDVLRGDGDWRLYTLAAPSGALRVTLDGPSGADFDVYVFAGSRVDANAVVAIGDSMQPDESVSFSSQGGTYSVLVRSAGGAGRFALAVEK
jgi:hypothetical protein